MAASPSPFPLGFFPCSGPVLLSVSSAYSHTPLFLLWLSLLPMLPLAMVAPSTPSFSLSGHRPPALSQANSEPLRAHWKRPGSVFVSCMGGRGRPWENSSKVQKNFTSSSLNKRASFHLFAQIFPLPTKKMLHLLSCPAQLSWGFSGPLFFMPVLPPVKYPVGPEPRWKQAYVEERAVAQGLLVLSVVAAVCSLGNWGGSFSRENFL